MLQILLENIKSYPTHCILDSVPYLTPQPMGGGVVYAPSCLRFFPLLKISVVNPYLKILDLAKLFVADAPIKKNREKNSFTPS